MNQHTPADALERQEQEAPTVAEELWPRVSQLRATIKRLTRELETRQTDSRPLPSSVMRAYQALIDKHYAQLARLEAQAREE